MSMCKEKVEGAICARSLNRKVVQVFAASSHQSVKP